MTAFAMTAKSGYGGALGDAFKHRGPALVDVVTDPDALSVPPKISAETVTGFAPSA